MPDRDGPPPNLPRPKRVGVGDVRSDMRRTAPSTLYAAQRAYDARDEGTYRQMMRTAGMSRYALTLPPRGESRSTKSRKRKRSRKRTSRR